MRLSFYVSCMSLYLCVRVCILSQFIQFVPLFFFFSSRRRHTRLVSDWSSDVCSSDLGPSAAGPSPRGCTRCAGGPPTARRAGDRKSVVEGKSGNLGGGINSKKKK